MMIILILSSEVGVSGYRTRQRSLKKTVCIPGKMLLVDTVKGEVIDDDELKETYATKQPYGEWLDSNLVQLKDLKDPESEMSE